MISVASVCLFVCLFVRLFVNTITSERANIGWWNLAGRCTVQKYRPSSNLGVIAPTWVRTAKNVALGYDVGKISAGCLVWRIQSSVVEALKCTNILNLWKKSESTSEDCKMNEWMNLLAWQKTHNQSSSNAEAR